MTKVLGLRDRKKAATRVALSDAAARLAREYGIEAVTADMIASAAGVSTRTFHNYFSCKEEAVLHHVETQFLEWADWLRERPTDEPILDSLEHIVLRALTESEQGLDEMCALADLIDSSPTLLVKKMEMHVRLNPMLDEVIAERTGADGLYPCLLQTVVGAACKASLDLWLSGRSTADSPQQLIREAFDHLRSGLAVPQQ